MPFDTKAATKAITYATQLKSRLDELVQPLVRGAQKSEFTAAQLAGHVLVVRAMRDEYQAAQTVLDEAYDRLCKELVPAAFEREKLTSFNLSLGYRVTISQRYFASIIPDKKPDAYKWLRSHKLGDLIQETVNAGTLSAAGKGLLEQGRELPEGLFQCYFQPNTSITKIAGKNPEAGAGTIASK